MRQRVVATKRQRNPILPTTKKLSTLGQPFNAKYQKSYCCSQTRIDISIGMAMVIGTTRVTVPKAVRENIAPSLLCHSQGDKAVLLIQQVFQGCEWRVIVLLAVPAILHVQVLAALNTETLTIRVV